MPPVEIGEVMRGGIIGVVEESKNPKFKQWDLVSGMLGWQPQRDRPWKQWLFASRDYPILCLVRSPHLPGHWELLVAQLILDFWRSDSPKLGKQWLCQQQLEQLVPLLDRLLKLRAAV